ncbi:MAG: FIG00440048: hypothetical protein [uncultured Sphingosinicella sp.]|uniref:Glutathione peroxidase n=1 Tax=uncultured Sphingosinicella sp. TaxID=478748 RepID=A0A6J4TYM0_9SPHN|nr:DUF3297 family protein [uncultured Sphingosinicella sp.]CAA9535939.1 MAG: FIG00440048: hypothetical protein [uncultured Sphingosinicella sp.]
MTDTPPDRLSLNPRSPHFNADLLRRGVGIRFKGQEKTNVEEYSVSEGWIRVAAGKSLDRYGQPMTIKLSGSVEPYYQDLAAEDGAPDETAAEASGGESAA